MTFAGFPSRPQATAIPNVFFTDLLPRLTDAVELAVVLYAFNVLARKKGFPRYLSAADLAAEPGLASFVAGSASIDGPRTDAAGAVERGLARAAEVGVLLRLAVERDGERTDLYFLNAPADRRAMESVRRGEVDLGRVVPATPPPAPRSSVFALYESLVGTMSPLVADELAEAERLYPKEWLEAAFREAAAQNARSWRYVSRILERWAIEGPDHAKTERDPDRAAGHGERYFRGKYGEILKRRLQP